MSKQTDYAGMGCILFFLLFWSVIVLTFDYIIVRDLWRQWKTSAYLETIGTVTHSKVNVHHGSEETSYTPVIHYDYTVGNQQYSGKVYRLTAPFRSKRTVYQIIKEHPVGKAVPVYYCPDLPQLAVLRQGLEMQDSFTLLFLAPFNGGMLLGVYGLLKSKYGRLSGFTVQDDGLTLRLRISSHDPIATAISGTLPAIFTTFPFFIFDGLNRFEEIGIGMGWGMTVLGGWLGARYAVRWNRSDKNILIVDKTCNELILPRQPDQTPGPVVPFDAIEDLTLSKVAAKPGDEEENHILTLHYRYGNETQSAIIASNHNRTNFFHFVEFPDTIEELMALKNWILREADVASQR